MMNLFKFLFIELLFMHCLQTASGQQVSPNQAIDSLIIQLPAMMRTNESRARVMIDELSDRSLKANHAHGKIQTAFYRAWLSYRHDPVNVAIQRIDSALKHIQGIQSDTALIRFYILKGQCYVKKTDFGQALDNFSEALKIAEKRNDPISKTNTLVSIGWAYMEDNKPRDAIHFFNEVLRLNPSDSYSNRGVLLCNIAGCYNTLGDFTLAEKYANQGISVARSSDNNVDLANGLNILGHSYYQQGKLKAAIEVLKEAAIVREKVTDPSMLASDYLELADLYLKNDQPRQAIAWAKKAESISIKYANTLKLAAANENLAEGYEIIGDHKNAMVYLKKLLRQKDSAADEHYNQAFAQMQVQYESQKKVSENLQLKKENLETKLRINNQQRWLMGLIAGMLLLGASVIYISKLLKSRYETRLALGKLQQQKEQIRAVIEGEERERKRIAADLHDSLGQTLAAAALQLNKVKSRGLPVDHVSDLIDQACVEVRNVSHQVTPEFLLSYGLVKAMEQGVDKLNDPPGKTSFTLFTHVETQVIDEMLALTIYRCFQELCTNILKHAEASQVSVQLEVTGEEIQLLVEDDGVGFSPDKALYGLGMKNIQSRVSFYDGSFEIDSTPGKGTTTIIKVSMPHSSKVIRNQASHA